MQEPSQIPTVAEPWFLAFDAAVEIPAMKPEDLAKAEPHTSRRQQTSTAENNEQEREGWGEPFPRERVKGMPKPPNGLRCLLFFAVCALFINPAFAEEPFDPESIFQPMSKAISVEGALAHFGTPRMPGAYVDTWNLGARFSLLPFGILHTTLLHGRPNGALEAGLERIFQRFSNVHQNFGGVLFELRYYLTGLCYGRFVPWIGGSIGPGGSDLNIGKVTNDSKLTGPFMALIRGEVSVAYFIDQEKAFYVGLQSQHASNSNFNGQEAGMNTNVSINTPWGVVMGLSWFFH